MNYKKKAAAVFNSFAQEYAEKYMDISVYRQSLDVFLQLIESDQGEILDIATGPGNIPRYILDRRPGLKIHGIDMAPKMVKIARENCPEAYFNVMDCMEISTLNRSFDAISCGFCIPYLNPEDVKILISHVYSLLKPGAPFLLSGIEETNKSPELDHTEEEDASKLISYYHSSEFLTTTLKNAGFKLLHTQSIHVHGQSLEGQNDILLISEKQ